MENVKGNQKKDIDIVKETVKIIHYFLVHFLLKNKKNKRIYTFKNIIFFDNIFL